MKYAELPREAALVRDAIAWLEASGKSPMLVAARSLVEGDMPTVPLDAEHVMLNVSSRAVRNFELGNDALTFSAGFGTVFSTLRIPYDAILRVVSEDDQGLIGLLLRNAPAKAPSAKPTDDRKSRFRIVRSDDSAA